MTTSRLSIAAALLLAAACGGDSSGPTGSDVTIVSGPTTDSIGPLLTAPLVIEIGGASGLAAGAQASLIAKTAPDPLCPSCGPTPFGLFTTNNGASFDDSLVVTTSAQGRVTVRLGVGSIAGPFWIRVRVPSRGIVDSVGFFVQTGNPVGVRAAPDTLIALGGSFTLRASQVDRGGNAVAGAFGIQVQGSSISLAGQVVQATAYGLTRVIAALGFQRDTAHIGVVPAGRIAHLDEYQGTKIVVANIDGSNRQVFDGPGTGRAYSDGLAWTTDGTAILYAMGPFGGQRLWRQAVSGGAPARVIPSPPAGLDEEAWPVFSPDGQTLYFSGRAAAGSFQLWRFVNGTSAPTPIAVTCTECVSSSPSPDGTRLAFVDGGHIVVLTLGTGALDTIGSGESVRWSPDGARIAYGAGTAEWIANADGGSPQMISPADFFATATMGWSPDSAWLVYTSSPWLEIYHVPTGARVPLRPLGSNLVGARWAPN